MKKRIIGAMCPALPLFVSTTVSAAAAQTYHGKMTGYVETTYGWIHVNHEQYSASGKTVKVTPLKKNLLGGYVPQSGAVRSFSGNKTITYQEVTSDGVYKLTFQVNSGADTSYVGVETYFGKIL
jgi:hypothetical protein